MTRPIHPAPLDWTPERIAAFWDYQSRFPETYFGHRHGAALAALLARLVPRAAAVLDFGTGPGFLLPHLLREGFVVTACDISPASVENAARIGVGQPGFAGALLSADPALRAKRFDAVVMTELVEHVEEPLLGEILAEIRLLLRAGGQLLVTTPNEEDLAAEQVFCPCCGSLFHRWQHVRSWSRKSLSERLAKAGFVPVDVGVTDFALEPPNSGLRVRLARIRARIDRGRPPHLWALARAPG